MAASPPRTITFAIRGPIARGDLPALSRRVCVLLEQSGATVAGCEVGDVGADAVSVDALERLNVVALERVDVALEELPLLEVHRRHRIRGLNIALLERGPRALERAVDRGDARIEQLGDLAGLPAQHLAQDQHGPLARREML